MLALLVIDRSLVPGRPELDADAVSELSGVTVETAKLLWRALGFPDVPDGEPVFTRESVEVLKLIDSRVSGSIFIDSDDDNLVGQVRAIGAGLARSPRRSPIRSRNRWSRRARPACPTRRSRPWSWTRSTGRCSRA